MSGETDLQRILTSLEVRRREGTFVYATVPAGQTVPDIPIAAMVAEVQGTSLVVSHDVAVRAGLACEFEAAWLTLTTHTSLAAVGVTAAIATALAMQKIPANVIAGFHHDHLLVPVDRVDEAAATVELLRTQAAV